MTDADRGFDNIESVEEGMVQDTLQSVMEKVWYGQPV